jgi:tripartite-type tricarboxylate transporter receptor subunit TctC
VCFLPVRAQVPSNVYRIVVPVSAGGPLDGLGRLLARALARHLNETVIVDNRPGAYAMIGTEYVVKAPGDGRTLLLASSFLVTNGVMYKLNFDPQRDLRPVIELSQVDSVLVARSGLNAQSPADLQRVAAAQPGGLNCAAPPGEMALACEKLNFVLGGGVVTVPFARIGPAMNALMGGHVDLMFAPRDAVVPQLAARRIVALASGGVETPPPPLDALPLLKDTWRDFTVVGFTGILVPASTPVQTVAALNRAFNAILVEPEVQNWLAAWGTKPRPNGPEKLAQTLADRTEYYRRLSAQIGLTPQ